MKCMNVYALPAVNTVNTTNIDICYTHVTEIWWCHGSFAIEGPRVFNLRRDYNKKNINMC